MSIDRFGDQTIVVTGGAGGIGAGIAKAFVAAGGQVVVADVAVAAAQLLVAELGKSARYLPLDVTDESSWISVLDSVDREYGGLDVLVNCAGYYQPNVPFEEMPLALWRKHFAINADGVFLGCKHGIQRMKQRGGAIVNIGSGMSIKAIATASAYCGSKAAVLMTTRTAAAAAGAYSIRVNAVSPGPVPTAMLRGNLVADQTEDELIQSLGQFSALQRLATPADVAHAVLFLSDRASANITGVFLPVDAGNLVGA